MGLILESVFKRSCTARGGPPGPNQLLAYTTYHISILVKTLTPRLNPCDWLSYTNSKPKQPALQETNTLQVFVKWSCMARGGPPGPNQQ